jgi:addiction module HigA family antidote
MARKLLAPIPPGEILYEEFMKPMGISINALARDIDVPPNRVSEIVNGKRAITADTALRLGKYFGVSPEKLA